MKLISGTKVPGTRIRTRRESKVCLSANFFPMVLYDLLTKFISLFVHGMADARLDVLVYLGMLTS